MAEFENPYYSDHTGQEIDESVDQSKYISGMQAQIDTVSAAVAAEKTRAEAQERALDQKIGAEKTRAEAKEAEIEKSVADETERAEGKEKKIDESLSQLAQEISPIIPTLSVIQKNSIDFLDDNGSLIGTITEEGLNFKKAQINNVSISEKIYSIPALTDDDESICIYTNEGSKIAEIDGSGLKVKSIRNIDGTELTDTTNILYKKTWYCCGDSFSEGAYDNSLTPPSSYNFQDGIYAGKNKVYSRFIALRNNMNLKLVAKSGATLGMKPTDSQYNNPSFDPFVDTPSDTNNFFYNQYRHIGDDADYITLYFGINDALSRCQLGTMGDSTVKTFYGALDWSLKNLILNHPFAHIGIIVTNGITNNVATSKVDGDAFCNAIRMVAKKYAIPYLDLSGDDKIQTIMGDRITSIIGVEIDPTIAAFRRSKFRVNPELNAHPNEYAHEYQSTYIENWLRTL